jgi:hypothetical protein
MLFKVATLTKIKSGAVTQAFRKWKRPTVKEGGTLVTRIGVLYILKIEPITLTKITEQDLHLAGIDDFQSFQKMIQNKKEGNLYKIVFELRGSDPRLELRNKTDFTSQEITLLKQQLKQMDERSKFGPWTKEVLLIIQEFPKKRAIFIAEKLEVEKDWLKPQIRKLKSRGLTISHEVGYEISPRGKALLKEI